MTDPAPIITRFAPSPTGHLHIGGARTALFCWALARGPADAKGQDQSGGGRFVLRIEDTDRARSSEAAAAGILEDLAWLGIRWDDGPEFTTEDGQGLGGDARGVGPFYQSQREAVYEAAFQQLLGAGLAYPAFDTPEELNDLRKRAEAEKRTFIYRRPDDYDHDAAMARAAAEPHVLRFRMPPRPVTVVDAVLGEVTFPYEELDDLVIRKRDAMPTYHMAVVVDDEAMGVTHILRGQEHLNNTPKHVALMEALGYRVPLFAHLPLIMNIDGSKMSKRDKDKAAKGACRSASPDAPPEGSALEPGAYQAWMGDKRAQLGRDDLVRLAGALSLELPEIDVEDFRAAGYLPEVLVNFIALLGWTPGLKNEDGTDLERFSMERLAELFTLGRVGKSASKFDRDKLLSFNAHTIQHELTDEAFAVLWLDWAERFDPELAAWAKADAGRWAVAGAAARPRARTLREGAGPIAFARRPIDAITYDAKAVKKQLLKGDPNGLAVLGDLRAVVGAIEPWSPDAIEAALASFAESRELKMGSVAQPLRVAMTGAGVSPPLGHTLGLLTRDEAIARIDRCLAQAPGVVPAGA